MRLRKIKDADLKLKSIRNMSCLTRKKTKDAGLTAFRATSIASGDRDGKGKFIIEQAKRNIDVNFVGCEVSETIALKAARKIAETNPPNIKIINCPAQELKQCSLPARSQKYI